MRVVGTVEGREDAAWDGWVRSVEYFCKFGLDGCV
jgi:hypothetical protein